MNIDLKNKKCLPCSGNTTKFNETIISEHLSMLNNWSANMYVDISKILEHKMNMLEHFKSQQYHWYFEKDVIRHFHADFQSYKKGDKYVEQYKIKQMYRL